MKNGLLAGALALIATPAFAEAPADNDAQALQALKLFASCAVQRTPGGAAALLKLDPESREYAKAANAYARGHASCIQVNGKMKFTSLPFAGFLAEALLAREAKMPSFPVEQALTGDWIEDVGGCVARKQPDEVYAVFHTKPGSESEVAALQPTGAALQSCIRQGQTVKLNRTAVRAMYALGVYRLSHPLQSKSEG